MDKSGAAVCVFHLKGVCERGPACPYRHIKADRTVVCKHWLRGLCKKGDLCEFLHKYDMSKMPECFFYAKFKACSNTNCQFQHIDPESKIKDCPWYDRGFCRHGPNCRHRHTRRVICMNYLSGFCPTGAECKHAHPRFDLPTSDPSVQFKKGQVVCHNCSSAGHKIGQCPKLNPEEREEILFTKAQQYEQQKHAMMQENNLNHNNSSEHRQNKDNKQHRPLDQVTCYKCGEKGHYANRCKKGYLAFLSSSLKNLPNQQQQQQPPQQHNKGVH